MSFAAQDIIVRSSPLGGKGIFAARDFKKDQVVLLWHPKVLTKEKAEALPEKEKHYIDIVDGQYLYMQPPERYINHSCEPNTRPTAESDVAIRDILAGEEITSDYGGTGVVSFQCNCGSAHCRGVIT